MFVDLDPGTRFNEFAITISKNSASAHGFRAKRLSQPIIGKVSATPLSFADVRIGSLRFPYTI